MSRQIKSYPRRITNIPFLNVPNDIKEPNLNFVLPGNTQMFLEINFFPTVGVFVQKKYVKNS